MAILVLGFLAHGIEQLVELLLRRVVEKKRRHSLEGNIIDEVGVLGIFPSLDYLQPTG